MSNGPLNLVFPNLDGSPRPLTTIAYGGLRPALRRAGLRKVTLHSLRHSFASALIMQGNPVTAVAHLLGHSSPTITLQVYSHWWTLRFDQLLKGAHHPGRGDRGADLDGQRFAIGLVEDV